MKTIDTMICKSDVLLDASYVRYYVLHLNRKVD